MLAMPKNIGEPDDNLTFKGKTIEFQGEGSGLITDETDDSIFIVSKFFTGWMFKTEYFELLGVEE
jgi:hypothetical protein